MPLSSKIRKRVHPDMVVIYDFGKGRVPAISHRDFLLFCGVTDEIMQKVDVERKQNGLPPAFDDGGLGLKPLG
jgi:hypothetical protein